MPLLRFLLYLTAIATSLACTVLLLRAYARTRVRLLLWSGLCFVGLTLNNLLVFVDLLVLPDVDLRVVRLLVSLAATSCLLYGFIWNADSGGRHP